MSRSRFCFIKSCKNAQGSVGIPFFRMPMKGQLRMKWVDKIRSQQEFTKEEEEIFTYINICCEHFESSCILKNGRLKIGSVPTIFR